MTPGTTTAPLSTGRLYYGWVLVFTLGITETITWGILYYGFTVFMPPMEQDLGWSRGSLSGAFSLALLLSGLAAVPVGRWLDHAGPRVLMTAGSVAASLLMLAWSVVTDLAEFYLLWAAIGVTMSAVLYEPAFASVTAWFERQRTRALTAVTLMAGFASTIFIPLAGWLIEAQGWRAALVTLAVLLAATTILPHALLLRRRPEDLGLHVDGDTPGVPFAAHAAAVPRRAGMSVREAIRHGSFRWLAVAFCLNTVAAIAVGVHLVAYLLDRGYHPTFAAAATGAIGAMQVFGRIVLGALGSRVPLRVAGGVVLGVQPLALLALLLVPGTPGVILFVVLFGAAKGAVTLIRPSFVASLYGRARYASIAGVLAFAVTLAQAAAPISAGVAYDIMASYDPILWVFVLSSAVASAAILLAARASATD